MEGLDLTSAPSLLFIGMPSAGKTTVGRLCAGLLGLPFVDFDEVIEARQGISVRQIFAKKGEEAFRAMERQLAGELSGLSGHVIAPGGGIVESGENMALLCRNSVACRLRRDISLIDPPADLFWPSRGRRRGCLSAVSLFTENTQILRWTMAARPRSAPAPSLKNTWRR